MELNLNVKVTAQDGVNAEDVVQQAIGAQA